MSEGKASNENALEVFGVQNARMATSLAMDSMESKQLILRCLQECDYRLTDKVNEKIVVTDYFIHDVECRNQKTGEVITAPRMVLIDADSKTWECVSETLVSSLRNIAFVYGKPPWVNGLTLVTKMKRKGERAIYFFEVKVDAGRKSK